MGHAQPLGRGWTAVRVGLIGGRLSFRYRLKLHDCVVRGHLEEIGGWSVEHEIGEAHLKRVPRMA